jgi:uncharacterized membrane protein/uncharacterized protein YegL
VIGGLSFGARWPFVLLLIIPYIWWVRRRTLRDLSPKHLQLSALARSAIVAMLALALTQPVIYRSGTWVSVIYLLDVSESASPAAVQSAIQWIRETNDSGHPAHARYVPFGANASVFETLAQLRAVPVAETSDAGGSVDDDAIDRSATNIEGAVERALHNFAPHHLKRLVLITDGHENAGQVTNVLPRLKAAGVHAYTMPLPARTASDVWVESIAGPSDRAAEEQFPLDVHIYSQKATSAEVRLRYGDKRLGQRNVQLVPGLNRVTFETSITDEAGPITIEAEVSAPDDSFPANNIFRSSMVVKGKSKVLYVESRAESARYLQRALSMEGFSVTTVAPGAMPATVVGLDAYDAIVLSDVARSSLSEQQMRAVATYVQDLGGGFILVGGENVYGADGGYSKTDVEKVLPVTFDAKKPHQTVAMIVVLDKSGSMGSEEMGYAKEAAKAPLAFLRNTDSFGVVAFDSNFYWPVPFQKAESRQQMIQAISTIASGGETDVFPALEAAYVELARSSSELKHVILMSDGHTPPAYFERLVTKMAEAKITVSTVALGASADNMLLALIAQWGQGRTYYVTNPSRVAQVFSDETELATGSTLREEPFTPVVKKAVQAFKGVDFTTAPPLLGYVATKSKETSEILLESNRGEPILARWQYGLGKTAVFTSDLKDRWAADWLGWRGYSKFWSQLVREIMRTPDDSGFDVRVARDQDRATIAIDAVEKNGRFRNKLTSELRVVAPDQSVSSVPIHQVGPGSYEAAFPLSQRGSYVFHALGENGGVSRALAYAYPDEYHFYPPNTDLLRAISSATKGRFQPRAEDIFDTRGETTSIPMPLWPYLAMMALALYLVDVLLRRVRLFEESSEEEA